MFVCAITIWCLLMLLFGQLLCDCWCGCCVVGSVWFVNMICEFEISCATWLFVYVCWLCVCMIYDCVYCVDEW